MARRAEFADQDPRLHRARLAFLFIRTLLIRPEASELADFAPELTSSTSEASAPIPKRHGVRSENVVAIDFARQDRPDRGSYYAGEMKKSVFTR